MQLVLIPVLLVAGITLIVLSANGVPGLAALLRAESPQSPKAHDRGHRGTVASRRSSTVERSPGVHAPDTLLVDLMQEMIGLGQQLTDLRREVEDLTAENRGRTASESPRRGPQKPAAA